MKPILFSILFVSIFWGAPPTVARAEAKIKPRVPVVKIVDAIHVGVLEELTRVIGLAEREHYPAVIIELDTPGGFLDTTREIVQKFLATTQIKIIVWVAPEGARAASAGSMITMAAHYAAMAPSTSIGAATPVTLHGDIGKDMKQKVENDTLSFVDGIAEKRGRNVQWARESVKSAASLGATEALKQHVIDGIHPTLETLWTGVRVKFPLLPQKVEFLELERSLKEGFLSFISNPNIAYGLMTFGALGIYVEMTHPGVVVPGALGALSLALGAITMKIIPIRPGAIGLLLLGLILLAVEVLTPLPTYGVAGLAGAAALFLSGLFLLDASQTDLHLTGAIWLPVFFVILAFMLFIGTVAARALRATPVRQGFEALIGLDAQVLSVPSRGRAKIQVRGELWDAQWAPGTSVDEQGFQIGQKVRVVSMSAFLAFVELKES